jgi:hypothetical protein
MNVFNDKKPYGFSTFKRFLNEFNKYSDKNIEHRDKSIFVKDDKQNYLVYIHASIIEFNGIGMILNPVDWWRFCFWIKKYNNIGSKGKMLTGVWK